MNELKRIGKKKENKNTETIQKVSSFGGSWVALSVGDPTLGFTSGHDLRVVGSSPASGSAPRAQFV